MRSRQGGRQTTRSRCGIYLFMVLTSFIVHPATRALSQVENVPVNNQVYEFLNRMGVRGVLPLYSNAMLPLSRRDVADFLTVVSAKKEELDRAENDYLKKFLRE